MYAINLCYKVPNEKADEIAAVIDEHAAFMQKVYVDGDDAVAPTTTFFAKAAEVTDPLDPDAEETGFTIFTINEIWASPDDVISHIHRVMDAPHAERFFNAFEYCTAAPMGTITFQI
ncbi:MAG: hypothetical protein CL487_01465 [Acidobacteria bacterium]|nr:hypothetical protein [Acidobacteriota bacterium]